MSRERHGRPGGGSKDLSTGRGPAGPGSNLCADEVVPYLQEGDLLDWGLLRTARMRAGATSLGSTRIRPPVPDHHDALRVELPPPERQTLKFSC
jgi:hypothetical protein